MSPQEGCRGRIIAALAVGVFLLVASAALAQEPATPKFDIFAGYSWYDPGIRVGGIQAKNQPRGFGLAGTYNFSKYIGLSVDGGAGWGDLNSSQTIMVGPRVMWRTEQFQPFIHVLGGLHRLDWDPLGVSDNGFGVKAGGGFDIPLGRQFSWRLIEANYVWAPHNFFPLAPRGTTGRGGELRTGIVYNIGGAPPLPPMSAACSASQPPAVLAGEPVTVSMTVSNIPPKHTVAYTFSSTGGKVEARESTANIDTAGLAPGQYTVTGQATDPKPRKGQGPVTCTSQFTVNEPAKRPPTISCSANPTTVRAGDPSTITSTAGNPDNRPLTYSYTSSAGRISGSGASATLDTAGAPSGPITINCTVTDDRGLSATSSTRVGVEVPPPPPEASKIGECDFPNKVKPWRVDNTCKAVLDDVALRMQREPDSKLVAVGETDPDEKGAATLAAERAANSKAYLVSGEAQQQIDPTRIEVRSGSTGGQKAEYYIVPPGATFNVQGTTTVDETKVKAQGRGPAPKKKAPPKP